MCSHFIVVFDWPCRYIQLTLLVIQGSILFRSIRSMIVFSSPKMAALWINSVSSTSPFGYIHTYMLHDYISFFIYGYTHTRPKLTMLKYLPNILSSITLFMFPSMLVSCSTIWTTLLYKVYCLNVLLEYLWCIYKI